MIKQNHFFTHFFIASLLTVLFSATVSATIETEQYIYTADNSLDGNALHGYKIQNDGTLASLPGSPYATGGLGNGVANFSQDGIITSPSGRLMFVVNPGSNDISVFKTRLDGSLSPVPGSPFPTGGLVPMSLALSGNILYVAHAGPNASVFGNSSQPCVACDYRGFRVRFNGYLDPIEGSKIDLEEQPAAFPLSIRFNPQGDVLMGSLFVFAPFQFTSEELNTFKLDKKTGLLEPAPGSPYRADQGSNQPIGFTFNPANPSQVFVANSVSDDPVALGTLSTWLMAETGQISEILESPTDASQFDGFNLDGIALATCWVTSTSDGQFLYATNTLTDNISIFRADESGATELLDVVPLPIDNVSLDSPVDVLVTPDDQYFYSVQTFIGSVVGWKIEDDGSLTALPSQPAPLPADSQPFGLALVEKPKFDGTVWNKFFN